MQKYRLEKSKEECEYDDIVEKHRKRKEREGKDDEKRMKDNLRAKNSMNQFRENLPSKYIPRVKKNLRKRRIGKHLLDLAKEVKNYWQVASHKWQNILRN